MSAPLPKRTLMDSAVAATLASEVATPEARALVDHLVGVVTAAEGRARKARSDAALADLQCAAGAFLADLLMGASADHRGGYVYRSRNSNSFTDCPVNYRPFRAVEGAWEAGGLVEIAPGFRSPIGARAARFKATPKLLSLCAERGVRADDLWRHFRPREVARAAPSLVLRGASIWTGGDKVRGPLLPIPEAGVAVALAAEVDALNDFLSGVRIEGAAHHRLFRGFAFGQLADYGWNKGGRLYSAGPGNYQQASQFSRLGMTFDGEPVVEIDLQASFLTIAHGVAGSPYAPGDDPYDVLGNDARPWVKAWTSATLTNGKPLTRWPSKHIRKYAEKTSGRDLATDLPASSVAAAMAARFPLLADLAALGVDWSDLMFLESQAVLATLQALAEVGVPALPVHDAVLVPSRDMTLAGQELSKSFAQVAGLRPRLHARTLAGEVAITPPAGSRR